MKNNSYISCDWLEGGLAFSPRAVHACCVCHHGDRGWPFYSGFSGGELPLSHILAAKEKIIDAVQDGGYENCMECPSLGVRSHREREYLFDVINLSHSTVCNLRCRYCYLQMPMNKTDWWNDPEKLRAGKNPIDLTPTFQSMINLDLLDPYALIHWGGGEPVLLDHFEILLRLLLDYGTSNYIATNGTIYSEPVREGLKSGNVTVSCSVDAGTAATYERIKQRDYFEKVWTHLAEYAKTGGSVEAKYIFLDDNSNDRDVRGFVQRVKDTGVKRVVCDVDAFDPDISEDIKNAIAVVHEQCQINGIQVINTGCGILGFPEKDIETDLTRQQMVTEWITRLFQVCRWGHPDAFQIQKQADALVHELSTGVDTARCFLLAKEFISREMTDETFLRALYQALFNRRPDADGYAHWTGQLASGKKREDIIEDFIASREFSDICEKMGLQR